MYPSIDGGWGSQNEDGSWNGMVGMITRGESEIAVSDFFITADRHDFVDFSIPIGVVPYVTSLSFGYTYYTIM